MDTPTPHLPTGFYVMDAYARSAADAFVAGPFDTAAAAEADRVERNCADDYDVMSHAPAGFPGVPAWLAVPATDLRSDR